MNGALLAAALAALAALPGGAAPYPDEAKITDPDFRAAYVRAMELKDEVVRLAVELQAVQKDYKDDPDPERFAARRETLRGKLMEAVGRLDDARTKFQVLGGGLITMRALGVVARPGAGASEEEYLGLTRFETVGKELKWIHQGYEAYLPQEAAAFEAALARAASERSRRRRRALGLGALAAGGAAALLLRRRGAFRTAPVPAPAPAAALGPEAFAGFLGTGRAGDWAFGRQWPAVRGPQAGVVKLLAPEFAGDSREAALAGERLRKATALRHPGVQAVVAVGVGREGVFLVVEPSEGSPLSQLLGAGKPLGAQAALKAMTPVARALDAGHAAGLVHGALTPERVLLLPDGSGRLTDFGVAWALAAEPEVGAKVFSPAYSAPEVLEGKLTLPSDLYSFGVVLYEMLFVRLPFEGTNLAALKQERRYPTPSALLGRPTPAADALFAGLLEPAARKRRPRPGALAASLTALADLGA
jgi:serine/threonine protein kinase